MTEPIKDWWARRSIFERMLPALILAFLLALWVGLRL
jgi:hypothetical protein